MLVALLLASPLACTPQLHDRPVDGAASAAGEVDLGTELVGVSGLSARGAAMVAVEERKRRVLLLVDDGADGTRVDAAVPVDGVPDGLDLEAIAALPDGRLWLGTEAATPRAADQLLEARLRGGRVRVQAVRDLPHTPFGQAAPANQGIEGLCHAGDRVLAALEGARETDGARRAPAWILGDGPVASAPSTPVWLALTSPTGKVSGLSCQPGDDGAMIAWGIERHYQVRRLVRWTVPPSPTAGQVLAVDGAWDLDPALPGGPNPEGLVVEPPEDPAAGWILTVITDNDHGGIDGPTRLFTATLARPPGTR